MSFCARCGTAMQLAGTERHCPSCHYIDYGNAPAFVVLQVGGIELQDAVDGWETPEEAARRLYREHTGKEPPALLLQDIRVQRDPPALRLFYKKG
ncbi:MAG: hypothetical protein ACYCW6_29810 [Candidatus Xenobia bacterium]